MRHITRKAAEALLSGSSYKNSNTEVLNKAMYLHGHKIAWFDINVKEKSCVFTNLTSARIYRLEYTGLEGCTVIIR